MNAKNYLEGTQTKTHLPYQSTAGLFNGPKKLFIHVNGQKEITDAITISKGLGINNLVIVNGAHADKVVSLLVKNNIPVVLDRPHRNPNSEDDSYDATYTIAKTLIEKGVLVSLGMEGQMERMNTRNLPFYAGTFAAFGLDKEVALQLITLNTAKVLGIDAFTGSLAVGKDATLFISQGDALEMRGNILTEAFIQGRKISLETHQTKLWRRYSDKYKTK
jgi:imidazolonepropionase-like amidohydrolase